MRAPLRVATVVLNYREVDDTLRCVRSIRASAHLDQQLVIVDNGADTYTTERLRAGLDGDRLINSEENLGYAGGNNLGIAAALDGRASYIWLLNPDTVVEAATLSNLLDAARARPDAGIIGSRILVGGDARQRVWFDGGHIDWSQAGATSHHNSGVPYPEVESDRRIRAIDYATGASMLVRREVFETVGLLPERYFLYFEETDFNLRAREAGWSIVLAPQALVHHYQRSHGILPTPHYVYYFVRNRLLFASEFTPLTVDEVLPYVEPWVGAWRRKVSDRAPDWLDTYEHLVRFAIDDARAGRSGRRDERVRVEAPRS